jgi:hypothetical protein
VPWRFPASLSPTRPPQHPAPYHQQRGRGSTSPWLSPHHNLLPGFDGAYLRFSGQCRVHYLRAGALVEEFADKAIFSAQLHFSRPGRARVPGARCFGMSQTRSSPAARRWLLRTAARRRSRDDDITPAGLPASRNAVVSTGPVTAASGLGPLAAGCSQAPRARSGDQQAKTAGGWSPGAAVPGSTVVVRVSLPVARVAAGAWAPAV